MSPRVLLLAPPASYRTQAYLDAASRLGVELLVASEGRHSIVPEIANGLHIDLTDLAGAERRVLEAARRRPIDGVVSTDDATAVAASRLAARLGLRHNPPEAVARARRKDLARQALADAALPAPWHRRLSLDRPLAPQLDGVPYPCVVKPLALSASRGVIRADDPAALARACARTGRIVRHVRDAFERRHLLVEQFVPGPEVALEGLLRDGELIALALFDKPDPLDGPFFEETYYVTPSRLGREQQDVVTARVAAACRAFGLREGPIHAEVRLDAGDAWVIEVAARTIGGDCARLLRFGAGLGLEEIVLSHAAGLPFELSAEPGAAGVLMIPTPRAGVLRRVEGVLEARAVAGVEDVVVAVREGYALTPLPEGGDYLGFVFARGESPAAVERSLRAAHDLLEVVVAAAWPLVPADA